MSHYREYIVIHHSDNHKDKGHKEEAHQETKADMTPVHEGKSVWEDAKYKEYIAVHGDHFTDELAEWAISKMVNGTGDRNHKWTVQEVRSAYEGLGYTKPQSVTWGDVAYSANMAYADFYGTVISTEKDCIRYAYEDVNDVDGYNGKVFNRWLSDVFGKDVMLNWEKYL